MDIEIINKNRKEFSGIVHIPDGYPLAGKASITESFDCRKEKGFYEEKKGIQLEGVRINFYKRSSFKAQEVWVKSNKPYIQMHFELKGGAAYYKHNDKKFAVPTKQGEFSTFYIPKLNGTLIDPPCHKATSLEIELSQKWIKKHLGHDSTTELDFLEGMAFSRPTLLGAKGHTITPAIYKTINELNNCPYTGNIKKLFIEGKLLELLALQFYQASTVVNETCKYVLLPQDIENLHLIKEIITKDLSKSYTIHELSNLAFMNRTKMQAGFKQLFGSTIHEFIVENRLMEAYKMLTDDYTNNWNISKIAERIGYKHYNHFSMTFKKRFGVPPSKFLKK